jgi:hypothetical protein
MKMWGRAGGGRLRLRSDGTCAETKFCLSAKRPSPFKLQGVSVHISTGLYRHIAACKNRPSFVRRTQLLILFHLRPNNGHNRAVINWLAVELWCTHDSESPEAILMCCSEADGR